MSFTPSDITDFYHHSRGRMTQRILRAIFREWWHDITGYNVLGYGYTSPFLGAFTKDDPLSLSLLMNKRHHPRAWPAIDNNHVAVCDDRHMPIETQRMERILVVHALETSEMPLHLLEEIWRSLEGNGRMILVVPNRAGIWSRAEQTPFGQGHPYSLTQLRSLLQTAGFSIERYQRALYVPPGRSRILISLAPLFEKIGRKLFPAFGGVLVVEASKQLFSTHTVRTGGPAQQKIPKAAPTAIKPG
jgi:SAM-dependent methyltransferase